MNFTNMMGMARDPSGYMQRKMIERIIAEHPNEWNRCREAFAGMDRRSKVNELKKLYKARGMDLESTARQYRISLR